MIDFIASENDIAEILRVPFSSVISDSVYPAAGLLHPRTYGITAHLLEHLSGKGRIKAGADADLLLFAPKNIHERGTYADPREYAAGMDWVFVNGFSAIVKGEFTNYCSGKIIKR